VTRNVEKEILNMKKIFNIWKKGWCVIGRLYLFMFISMLFSIPFQFLPKFLPKKTYSVLDDEGLHLDGLLMLTIGLMIVPFIFYFASRISKEFILPREAQNQWLERSEKDKQNQRFHPIADSARS